MLHKHNGFDVKDSGLVINHTWAYIGASPDGIVKCNCCTNGIVEIKCPFCHRNDTILDSAAQDKKFCLKQNTDGTLITCLLLSDSNADFVCGVKYCDFVVCTFSENQKPVIPIEHISADHEFWSQSLSKSAEYFKMCILPEILGRWHTRPCISNSGTNPEAFIQPDPELSTEPNPSSEFVLESSNPLESQSVKNYCYSQEPERDGFEMIVCDHPKCKIEWFHTQ